MLDVFFTVQEVAEKLKVSDQLLYKLIREHKFPHKKIGTRIIISEKELENYINKVLN